MELVLVQWYRKPNPSLSDWLHCNQHVEPHWRTCLTAFFGYPTQSRSCPDQLQRFHLYVIMQMMLKQSAKTKYIPRHFPRKNRKNASFVQSYIRVRGKKANIKATKVSFGKTNAVCQRYCHLKGIRSWFELAKVSLTMMNFIISSSFSFEDC